MCGGDREGQEFELPQRLTVVHMDSSCRWQNAVSRAICLVIITACTIQGHSAVRWTWHDIHYASVSWACLQFLGTSTSSFPSAPHLCLPTISTKPPMKRRAAMAPHTAATPALPSSDFVRNRSSRITGTSAAGANVATNDMKKDIHDNCGRGQTHGDDKYGSQFPLYIDLDNYNSIVQFSGQIHHVSRKGVVANKPSSSYGCDGDR